MSLKGGQPYEMYDPIKCVQICTDFVFCTVPTQETVLKHAI